MLWQQGSDGQTLQLQFGSDGSIYVKCTNVLIQADSWKVDAPKATFTGDLESAKGASAEVQVGPVTMGFSGGILKYVK